MAEVPISEGIKDILDADSEFDGWTFEIGIMPKTPDKVIMISDTGQGNDPNPKWLLDFPTVQVMVRGGASSYLATYTIYKAAKDILLGLTSQAINSDRWNAVNISGDLGFIGRDENNRPMFSVNFQLIVEPQVPAGTHNREALPT